MSVLCPSSGGSPPVGVRPRVQLGWLASPPGNRHAGVYLTHAPVRRERGFQPHLSLAGLPPRYAKNSLLACRGQVLLLLGQDLVLWLIEAEQVDAFRPG